MKNLIFSFLFFTYGINRLGIRNFIIRIFVKLDGGQMYSLWLRKVFKKYHKIEIGYGTYGACFNIGAFPAGTKIGNYCSLSSVVKSFNANHPAENFTLHPILYNPVAGLVKKDHLIRNKLSIGHDVWIGHNVIILPKVSKIGNGVIIGAGSVVTKNVDDFEIVAGNPAKLIKKRFNDETCRKLLAVKWWNLSKEELFKNKDSFQKIIER